MDRECLFKNRFYIQTDKFAKDRIQALKDSVHELKMNDERVVSVVLYGSLSKGTATCSSDIDAFMFVRPSSKQLFSIKWGEGIWEELKIRTCCPFFTKEVDRNYTSSLHKKILERINCLSRDKLTHVQVLPINKRIIDAMIQHIELDTDSEGCFFSEVLKKRRQSVHSRVCGPSDPIAYPSVAISALFHFELCDGLQEFREYVIHKLRSDSKLGDRLWAEIVCAMESREQNVRYSDLPTPNTYPRTLEDASEVYRAE